MYNPVRDFIIGRDCLSVGRMRWCTSVTLPALGPAAPLQLQPVCNHGNKFRICRLPFAEFTCIRNTSAGVSRSPRSTPLQWHGGSPAPLGDGVVENRLATSGYSTLVTALMTSMSCTAIRMSSRRY